MLFALGRVPRDEFAGTLILSASVGEEQIEGAALRPICSQTQPDFAVIVEPTACQLAIAQKGRTEFWIEVSGKPAHTSRPELGENAVERAVDLVPRLRTVRPPVDPRLGSGVMTLIEMHSSPFPGECIVPYNCRLRYDRRLVPGETRASVLAEVRTALEGAEHWSLGYQTTSLTTYTGVELHNECFFSAWELPENSPWLQKACRGLISAGIEPVMTTAPYCTNGSYTAGEAGIPSLIFGPSQIGLAHVVDEYIEVTDLWKSYNAFTGLAKELGKYV
jgi:acetylornithine deacetylase/succinyl-diaminopimelate desuccinylase-like protein